MGPVEHMFPDLASKIKTQFVVFRHEVDYEVDPAEDRVIEVGYSVCSEEHDTITIFQFLKKHRNQLVASDILLRVLF